MKLACMLAAVALATGGAQAEAASSSGLAINDPALTAAKTLGVSSPKIPSGGVIPDEYTSYGKSISPPLAWGPGPAGTRSFALILEDPDAATPVPFQHWLAWNIPASAHGTPEGALPKGAVEGKLMIVNRVGYMGPRPPAGPPHHYHFQVFALDRPLELAAGAGRGALVDAMKGHVLAAGELVGTYQKK